MRKMRLLISCLLLGLANAGEYSERFLTLYNQIVDSNNGYYSSHGVPYHSLENMLVETVDHGHETDSEAISYNIWLHAMYGAIADDFAPFNNAWSVIENYLIPQAQYNMDNVTQAYSQTCRLTVAALRDEQTSISPHIMTSLPKGLDVLGHYKWLTVSLFQFFGVGSSIARSLSYYAAKSGDSKAKSTAKQLLDVIWKNHKDSKGLYVRSDLSAFTAVNTKVYIPVDGWTGTYPNGDKITASSSFLDIRSWYKQDENWPQLQAYLNGGSAPVVDYHRFWEQADMALALGAYSLLFE
ncbi:hypothetical protein HUJ04_013210 [Dendroctonus ponderosae]|nr:hypothetical protein HUJ04_013210 [Dendroctonus ponderosae]